MKTGKSITRRVRLVIIILVSIIGGAIFLNTDLKKSVDRTIKADQIIVEKGRRIMTIYSNDIKLKSYRISLGGAPVGDKQYQGDNKTPEGDYYIKSKDANSRYHRSLLISYPDSDDIREAQKAGKDPGGAILIHGIENRYSWVGKAHLLIDWTLGCIAVTNNEIEEIFDIVDVGVPIRIIQ